MNFKTTLVLAVVLIGMVGAYFLVPSQPEKKPGDPTLVEMTVTGEHPVFAEPLGDARKLVITRAGQPDWVFEPVAPDGGSTGWKMTAPLQFNVPKHMLDNIVNPAKGASIDQKYTLGQGGSPTLEAAGLSPPRYSMAITDDKGRTATVHVGKDPVERRSYIRLGDEKEIILITTSFKDMVKTKPSDYRDPVLMSFKHNTARRIEIVDHRGDKPTTYKLSYNGKEWVFEQPIKAATTTREMTVLAQGLSSLRVQEWIDLDAKDLSIYGLAKPALTVTAVAEEPADAPKSETPSAESAPSTVLKTYTVHISEVSPLGEDTKTFVAMAGSSAVGTILKGKAESFDPKLKLNLWRDMRLITANVKTANRVELSTPQGAATFEKSAAGWVFSDSGQRTGDGEVEGLLEAIDVLRASAFVDGVVQDEAAFGLAQPQAEIRLAIPEVVDTQQLVVGGYTDANSKLLLYVRSGTGDSVGKVRATDVLKLVRPPAAYRDRSVVRLSQAEIARVAVTRTLAATGKPMTFALTREGTSWMISEPALTATDNAAADGFVAALADLHGASIVTDVDDPAEYGLSPPAAVVEMALQGNESAPSEEGAGPVKLLFGKQDGTGYVQRVGKPEVYTLDKADYDRVFAEYHAPGLFTFDPNTVKAAQVQPADGKAAGFSKVGQNWKYSLEPDLPIDDKKVKNYYVQLKDLKTTGYVAYGAEDVAEFGLDAPQHVVTVTPQDGLDQVLRISAIGPPSGGRFAVMGAGRDVFVLPPDAVTRITINPAEFLADAAGAAPAKTN